MLAVSPVDTREVTADIGLYALQQASPCHGKVHARRDRLHHALDGRVSHAIDHVVGKVGVLKLAVSVLLLVLSKRSPHSQSQQPRQGARTRPHDMGTAAPPRGHQ